MQCTCKSAAGVQKSSAKNTVDAAVSVSAIPAAVMARIATRMSLDVWNCCTRECRSLLGVCPSIRMYDSPR